MHASQLAQGKGGVTRNRMHPDTIGSSAIRSDVDSHGARGSNTKLEHQRNIGPYLDQDIERSQPKLRTSFGHNNNSSAVSYNSNVTPNTNKRSAGQMQPLRANTMMKYTKVDEVKPSGVVKTRKASMDVRDMSRNNNLPLQ